MSWLMLGILVLAAPAGAGSAGPVFTGDPAAVAEIKAVFENFAGVNSYKGRMTTPGAESPTTIEWAKPNLMRMVTTNGGQAFEMVVIGSKAWVKAQGQCSVMPGAQSMAEAPTERIWGQHVQKIHVTKGGTVSVNKAATQSYLLAVTGKDGKMTKNTFHVNLRSRLPQRLNTVSDDGKKIQIDYMEYNTPVKISPPC